MSLLSVSLLGLEALLGLFQLKGILSQRQLPRAGCPFPDRRCPHPSHTHTHTHTHTHASPTRLASSLSGLRLHTGQHHFKMPAQAARHRLTARSINQPVSLPPLSLSVPRHFSQPGVWTVRRKKSPLHHGGPMSGSVLVRGGRKGTGGVREGEAKRDSVVHLGSQRDVPGDCW